MNAQAATLHDDADARHEAARTHANAVVVLRPRVLRKLEAAKYIGIGRTKIEELIAQGRLEAKRAGGVVLVTVASLDAYLDGLPNAREG
jgi:excisionase family DNA binding protein